MRTSEFSKTEKKTFYLKMTMSISLLMIYQQIMNTWLDYYHIMKHVQCTYKIVVYLKKRKTKNKLRNI